MKKHKKNPLETILSNHPKIKKWLGGQSISGTTYIKNLGTSTAKSQKFQEAEDAYKELHRAYQKAENYINKNGDEPGIIVAFLKHEGLELIFKEDRPDLIGLKDEFCERLQSKWPAIKNEIVSPPQNNSIEKSIEISARIYREVSELSREADDINKFIQPYCVGDVREWEELKNGFSALHSFAHDMGALTKALGTYVRKLEATKTSVGQSHQPLPQRTR